MPIDDLHQPGARRLRCNRTVATLISRKGASMKLTFLGAAQTVTGSKYLLEHGTQRILVDCGLFQGAKHLRLRNWNPLPVAADRIDAVLLTHAHVDHCGYLPVLTRHGFRGPVYCTAATAELVGLMLRDSARLQEEEAAFANRHGYSRHHPALPLYDSADAERAIHLLVPRAFDMQVQLPGGVCFRFLPAGHILGAASIVLCWQHKVLAFSGDLGRDGDPLIPDPQAPAHADYVVLESTYGDRRHPDSKPEDELAPLFETTFARGGTAIVPSFAVGRTQELLYYIARLRQQRRMADVPVYVDSPLATRVTGVYRRHLGEHRLSVSQVKEIDEVATIVHTIEESKQIAAHAGPKVIIAGSGMATGGRVLHHLRRFAPDPRNTILLVGYQASGTRGAALAAHEPFVKMYGEQVPIRAQVAQIASLSAHADYADTLRWLASLSPPPTRVYLTHGEPPAAEALRQRIAQLQDGIGVVPDYLQTVELD